MDLTTMTFSELSKLYRLVGWEMISRLWFIYIPIFAIPIGALIYSMIKGMKK